MDRIERERAIEAPLERMWAALADPTRRAVLEVVARHAEATATLAARELPVSRQAVVKHLGVLDEAGLVTSRRQGREVRYRVCVGPMRVTARWLEAAADDWDARLAAIRETAEEGSECG
ncbi:metalloregulator ArsR/SmtB family transcription factor [soil metagenome]